MKVERAPNRFANRGAEDRRNNDACDADDNEGEAPVDQRRNDATEDNA